MKWLGEQYPKASKIRRHHDQRQDKRQCRHHRPKQGADNARTESEQEGDEGDATGDGVQDHDVGEAVGGGRSGLAKAGAFDFSHDFGGRIADCAGEAVVLVGAGSESVFWVQLRRNGEGCCLLDGWNIEDAVAKLYGIVSNLSHGGEDVAMRPQFQR